MHQNYLVLKVKKLQIGPKIPALTKSSELAASSAGPPPDSASDTKPKLADPALNPVCQVLQHRRQSISHTRSTLNDRNYIEEH
jgi:hypothetical protein